MFASSLSSARARWVLFVMVTLVALLGSLLAVVSPPAPAHAEVTGTGGQYVPMDEHARVFDGATAADSFKTVQIAGVDGLPSSGIGAVSLMLTVVNPNGQGQFVGRPDADGANTLLMIYGAGVDGNTSNTSLLAVGGDGKVRINTQTAQSRVVIDVTGYYTSTANGVGAGGFVPVSSKRIVNTGTALNAPQGPLTNGKSFTFTAAGANGIPANAAAVSVNVIVNNTSTVAGWVRPFPAGSTDPSGALNYGPTGGLSTAMMAQVGVGDGGKITIDTSGNGSSVNVIVDVQGYFMPSNPGGGFTPQTGRLIDTRSGTAVAANGTVAVQVAGALSGIPSVEGGLSAVAITLTEIHSGTSGGYAKVWADGAPEPDGSVMDYSRNTSTRTTTATIPVGVNGKIRIKNAASTATDFVVDLQGTYNSLPGGPSNTNQTGQRKSATTLPFPITDQTNASVDVGTGNLLVTTSALTLPGVTQSTTIGAAYNSRATNKANSNTMDANRWQYALAGAGDLSANSSGVVYTDAAGTAWLFKPTGTTGAFTTPAGLQQTLSRVNTSGTNYEYTLKGWTTNLPRTSTSPVSRPRSWTGTRTRSASTPPTGTG